MKKTLFFTAGLISMLFNSQTHMQVSNPPVVFEALAGNTGFASQMTVNKGFEDSKKLGFFSVANISSKWSEDHSKDAMIQANITFEVIKNIRLLGGSHYTPTTGLRPTAGLIYSRNFNGFLLIINPRFIGFSKSSIAEGFVMMEYKPKISENWKGYSRIQGLYSETIKDGEHARSYLMLRIGMSYKSITFGAGANFDSYGPFKESKQNYGIFAAARLFN
ncbi:hypothetical protein CLU96_2222 [Chryseobacterium sp. 52]|uniref:hypothetical protein n=1 Tax=Chryseobacterium sp. 52 TaxID=2035213 RepID=UPI000C39BC79|nr:hypothetical protein [Chryseobacterium sp. 52]PIF45221.1 hypothetical protein CLU96_2222 [Chryseobacterium sp. 52]